MAVFRRVFNIHIENAFCTFLCKHIFWVRIVENRDAEKGSISNSREGNTPDNLQRLVSITKQISATTYNTYDSPQFNPHRSPGKKPHAFVLMVMFPRHQNETSSAFLVAWSEKREESWGGGVCFKKGVGINYPTQETCRTSGYCLGLVSILVMYWQTLLLISLKPGVIKKQGPYWGPIGFWIPFRNEWQAYNVKKNAFLCFHVLTCMNSQMILSMRWKWNHAKSKFVRLALLAVTALTNIILHGCICLLVSKLDVYISFYNAVISLIHTYNNYKMRKSWKTDSLLMGVIIRCSIMWNAPP